MGRIGFEGRYDYGGVGNAIILASRLSGEAVAGQPEDCQPEEMGAEDPLFILYTSGSTGKPKGVLHTTGGYHVYVAMTHQYVFDYHDGDIYWCTADVGWVTGHSYIVYGPLANGATVVTESRPGYGAAVHAGLEAATASRRAARAPRAAPARPLRGDRRRSGPRRRRPRWRAWRRSAPPGGP